MSRMSRHHPLQIQCPSLICLAGLALAGCATKKDLPNNAGDLGLGSATAATPGSQQDFTVNVGDRIFFDTDSSAIRADAPADARPSGAVAERSIRSTRSPSKAMPTSAARANTTSRSAPAVPRPPATISHRSGVPANRIKTISYGKERPVAVCDDISCWSQNRRAVTVLGGAGRLIAPPPEIKKRLSAAFFVPFGGDKVWSNSA